MMFWVYFLPLLVGSWLSCLSGAEGTSILFPSDLISSTNLIRSNGVSRTEPKKTYVTKEQPPCLAYSSHGTICEDDNDYDDDVRRKFKSAIEKIHMSNKVYTSILSKMMVDVVLQPRFGTNEVLEEPVCPSTQRIIFPQRGKTKNEEWVHLLNQGNMRQGIKVEECLNATRFNRFRSRGGAEWSCSSTASDYEGESSCRQKYIYRTMISMDAKGSELSAEPILIPSCCVCQRKKVFVRLGSGSDFGSNANRRTPGRRAAPRRQDSSLGLDASHFGLDDIK